MTRKKRSLIIGVMMITLLGGFGCMKGEESNTIPIGMALRATSNSWWKTVTSYATYRAASLQQPYFIANADSAKQQRLQLTGMAYSTLQRNACKAIILYDLGQTTDSIQKYIDMGIGIILFDCDMPVDYTCRVSGNNADAGKKAGDYIKARLTDLHPTTLIIKADNSPTGTVRADACRAQLSGTVVETVAKTYTRAAGKKAMQEALAASDGVSIGAVYALDDDIAIGVIEALQETQNASVQIIVGCGGSQAFLTLIDSATDLDLATTVYPPEMITQCVNIANEFVLLGSKPTQKEIITDMPLVNKSNVAEYIGKQSAY